MEDNMAKQRGLGKGLGALLSETEEEKIIENNHNITELKLSQIQPNQNQPRKEFDQEKLEQLAASITEHGIIQPLIVSPDKDDFYTIIAGERRWRASKLAGLRKVPVIIKDFTEQEKAEIALVENLQREDLNPVEEAEGFRSLMDDYHLTQEEVSKRVGKSRSAIANTLRLLSLPENIRDMLSYGEITSGHARALVTLDDPELQKEIAQKIIAEDLNVRQTEKLVKEMTKPKVEKAIKLDSFDRILFQNQLEKIEKDLEKQYGTKVIIQHGKKKGKIIMEYYGNDELDRVLELLAKEEK